METLGWRETGEWMREREMELEIRGFCFWNLRDGFEIG